MPLTALWERATPAGPALSSDLERLYGGRLDLPAAGVVANFVSSLDGVVALPGVAHSSQMISDRSEADRFVMGSLRAHADAVMIGAGTLRGAPDSLWSPAFIYPEAAPWFVALRHRLGRSQDPRLVILTAKGDIDTTHPALQEGALVLTTARGAAALRDRLPSSSSALAVGDGTSVDLRIAIGVLRRMGYRLILSEGGPTVVGELLRARLLQELFLTVSPMIAGRSAMGGRPGLVDGAEVLPSDRLGGQLMSIRTHGSHLFLRYAFRG